MPVSNKCCSSLPALLLKDYRIFKLFFTIFGSWLISYSIYTFVVVKPTYTSNEQREKSVEDFPEIMICPEPSVQNSATFPTLLLKSSKKVVILSEISSK